MSSRTTRLTTATAALLLAGSLAACQGDEPVEPEAPVASGEVVLADGGDPAHPLPGDPAYPVPGDPWTPFPC
ncbi:hypothetical protein ACPYO6_04450 [Georgenia sp. Z1344]|uniref:hypothetical protein n=1 Tax=Georgenia sp. Z1344 TaxID=3416706 RepID=UPI003CEC3716